MALRAKSARVTKPSASAANYGSKRRSARLATKPYVYTVRRRKDGLLNLDRTPDHLIPV